MRLQLIAALAALALAAPSAWAQVEDTEPGEGTVSSKVALYADDDDTTVLTTIVDGEVRLPAPIAVGAHVVVDSVSSASVDVVSAATERWTENRVEAGARLSARAGETDATVAYVGSAENDWLSHSVQATVARELARDNARVQLGYGYTHNDVGRASDPTFARELDSHTVELGVTQLIDRRTYGGVTYTLQRADGYQASPYRYVTSADGVTRPETHPKSRTRHAVTVRVVRAVGRRVGWDSHYRLYGDDWGIVSHTVASALNVELGDSWDLRVRVRGYYQGAAEFFAEVYDRPARYMSADRELGTFWDGGGGARLAWRAGSAVVDAKVEGIYYRFIDFARLDGRVALVSAVGVRWAW